MKTITFSKNAKLNKVLNSVYESLLSISDTEEESISEIKRYVSEFKGYPDYNLYKHGNLIIEYCGIHSLYSEYKSLKNASDCEIEAIYMHQVKYVANYILSNNN